MKDISQAIAHLKSQGYYVIENYYSPEICNLIVKKIQSISISKFEKTPTLAESNLRTGGDYRIAQSQHYIPECNSFLNDPFINKVADIYIGHPYKSKRCMANVVTYNEDTPTSSGGGWHVDNHSPQFKSFMFLTDVNNKNGPLSIVENSSKYVPGIATYDGEHRITEETVFKEFSLDRIKTMIVKKGTLVLADTSNIHRGNKIQEGTRYALTNYFYH